MKHKRSTQHEKPSGAQPALNGTASQTGTDFAPCPEEVARHAYFNYVNEGAPQGRDLQHWLDAESRLLKEHDLTHAHGFHN